MTYNRDLQEDKERLFDTADNVRATLRICAAMLGNLAVNRSACKTAAGDPALLATDLADYLVRKGAPFRQAHHVVGSLVALAEKQRKKLNELTLAQLQSIDDRFGTDALQIFSLEKAMARRRLPGAPGTRQIAAQLKLWKQRLGSTLHA